MLRCITLRLALPVVLAAALLSAPAFAQSQDSQSVAEAARRARGQKKSSAKPAKVITEDDVKPAAQASPATPAPPDATTASGTPAPPASSTPVAAAASSAPASPVSSTANAASAPAASSTPAPGAKDQKISKEVTELKAKIKQAQSDLDLLQREQSLEQDNYYSNSDYVHDTAGKAKLDALKQQISDKQQELERLKARLAELQLLQGSSPGTPPQP